MVIQNLAGKTVFLDTAPLIYFIEGHGTYQTALARFFKFNDDGGFTLLTTTITLPEVLVKPLREGNVAVAQQYRDVLTSAPNIEILDVSTSIAETAAHLRATYSLKTPDSIQLAAALEAGADYFLTNDLKLKAVTGIAVVGVSESS